MSDVESLNNSEVESEGFQEEEVSANENQSEEQMETEKVSEANEDPKFAIEIKQSNDKRSATYTFSNESHTVGNALRYVIMNDKNTQFCGYSIVHPSEPFMNLRIQTTGENSNETLKRGFDNLEGIARAMKRKLEVARQAN